MICRQPVHRHTSTFHQSFQPMIASPFQHLKPLFYKNTVLTHQVHHIPDRSNRHIFHQIIYIVHIPLHHLIKSLHQLISYRSAAEPFERIFTVRPVRINYRIRLGHQIFTLSPCIQIGHLVMIRHDYRKSHLLSISNLIHSCDSIITGNNRIDSVIQGPVDQHPVQSVPILDSVWNVRIHLAPQPGNSLLQYISRVHPIYIIIPDYPDRRPLTDLLRQNLHRLIHILHQHTIKKICNRSIQIKSNLLIRNHIPVPNQPRQNRRNPIPLPNPIKIRLLHRNKPLFHLISSSVHIS